MKKALGILLVLVLLLGVASAETLETAGTVTAGTSIRINAPIGGTVADVNAEKGMLVNAGDLLVTLETNKVYAAMDGTVTGVFVQPGDDAEDAASTYGADLYLESTVKYTLSCSTDKAYSSEETTFVHVGETVYMQCRTNTARVGTGMITAVDGTNYTVFMTEGSLFSGDQVFVYRDEAYTAAQRIGQGRVSRVSPTAVSTSGAVVRVAVKDGDTVKKGDLLLETLNGTFSGYTVGESDIKAPEAGAVAEVNAEEGGSLSQGSTAIVLYPLSGMQVETTVEEDDLAKVKAGDPVRLELSTDETKVYQGTVRRIDALSETDSDGNVCYRVYIDFTPDDAILFGMSMEVTFGETVAQEAAAEPAAEETVTEEIGEAQ